MSGRICGNCTNWRYDNPLLMAGHCIINRIEKFHGAPCDSCKKYQSTWEYIRPLTEEEQKGGA